MLGVDIGTTSTKAVLFDEYGATIDQASYDYPIHTPTVDTAEQDPYEIYQAVLKAISSVTKEKVLDRLLFVSFSSAMHSVIAVDHTSQPLTACITWADNRSSHWAHKIKTEKNGLEIYRRTGTPIHPMSPLSKITWLVHDKPEIAAKTHKYIGIKEFVFKKLFNQYVIDYSLASATGLMNLDRLEWDQKALEIAGITSEQLSQIVPTTSSFQTIDPSIANQIGVPSTTPFIIGASDGVLSNLGVGAIGKGEIAITIGTSGAIRTTIDQPQTDKQGRTFCYALTDNHWVIGGPVNNGGVVLRWIKDVLATEEVAAANRAGVNPYDYLIELAGKAAPGANGLIFHPYLTGERAPSWNPDVRASYVGLTLSHQKKDMIRAALEGVIFNLYSVYLALTEAMDHQTTLIRATGGFARSSLWRQILADIFESEVTVPESYESSCLGACFLGLYATGKMKDFEEVTALVGHTYTHKPNPLIATQYQSLFKIYSTIAHVLETEYQSIANYQRNTIG